jgi:exosortase D (VPLPA-CTERM-specific)
MKVPADMADRPALAISLRLGSPIMWPAVLITLGTLGFLYESSLAYLVEIWMTDENYGHGFFVPLISLYLAWEQRQELAAIGLRGSWLGLPVVLLGIGLYVVGELATLHVLLHYSLWLVLAGMLLCAMGTRGVRTIGFPLLFLLTMIPLPQFLYQSLSAQLQLISSSLGVGCLQVVGITAFREGNVIDLGPIQLQVVEACSGLRYLFPLMTLSLLCAYLYRDRMWKRVVLVLSSVPIAILVNGARIGLIGALVEYYGRGTAEGFAHLFEGWLLFVVSLGLIVTELWLLSKIGRPATPRPFVDSVERPPAPASSVPNVLAAVPPWTAPAPAVAAVLCVLGMGLFSTQLAARQDMPPPRRAFVDFPLSIDRWDGLSYTMEKAYRDVLRFDDYFLADYRQAGGKPVNLYLAYYRSQRKGQSAHSPRTCLPGGGWEIVSLETKQVPGGGSRRDSFPVNRAIIQKGEQKQVVYYWFRQRGRVLTDEYLVKWYLFWDALTRRRTDGALVRLMAMVQPGEEEAGAEARLASFTRLVEPELGRYIPD